MNLNYFYFSLIVAALCISACCKKDDEQPPEIPNYPIRLAFVETGELGTPMLKTFGTDDIPVDSSLSITQMAQDLIADNRVAFPDSIVLTSDNLSYFDAADSGFLSTQSALDNIPYSLVNDSFTFNLISSDKVISGTGSPIEIKIPYQTFFKKGVSSSGGTHLPVSYENFLFTDFFDGDSIVYIKYDVIYKLAE